MRRNDNKKIIDPARVKWIYPEHNGEDGVVTGCDKGHEWMLQWWWDNYSKHNDYPVTWANFGMSAEARQWCTKHGKVVDLNFRVKRNWFKKPMAILGCPYKRIIWTDTDCEIRENLAPLFEYATNKVGVTLDPHTPWVKADNAVASGVIATYHGNRLMVDWGKKCLRMKNMRGDQEVFNSIIADKNIWDKNIAIMPPEYQWLRIDGDREGVIMMHWTGTRGKDVIRQQLGIAPRRTRGVRSNPKIKTKQQAGKKPKIETKPKPVKPKAVIPIVNDKESIISKIKLHQKNKERVASVGQRVKTLKSKYKPKPR